MSAQRSPRRDGRSRDTLKSPRAHRSARPKSAPSPSRCRHPAPRQPRPSPPADRPSPPAELRVRLAYRRTRNSSGCARWRTAPRRSTACSRSQELRACGLSKAAIEGASGGCTLSIAGSMRLVTPRLSIEGEFLAAVKACGPDRSSAISRLLRSKSSSTGTTRAATRRSRSRAAGTPPASGNTHPHDRPPRTLVTCAGSMASGSRRRLEPSWTLLPLCPTTRCGGQ